MKTEHNSLERKPAVGTTNLRNKSNDFEVNYEKGKKPGVIGYVFVGVFKAVKWLFVRG